MARNDQLIRQWHILRELESSQGKTINEFAQCLSSDYPKQARTIRRDIHAREAAGFPLINERRSGIVRWKLMDGYGKLPALGSSASEIMALILARRRLELLGGTHIQVSLPSAMAKDQAGLPDHISDGLENIHSVLAFGLNSHKSSKAHWGTIDSLSQAISQKHTVHMRDFSASRNQTTRREVDSYRLWYTTGARVLVAYCHRRQDGRLFAVERIRAFTLTDHPFQMALGFNVHDYVQDALGVMRGRPPKVERRFDNDRRMGAGPHLASQSTTHATQKRGMTHDAYRCGQPRTPRRAASL